MSAGAFGLHYSRTTPPPIWRGGLIVENWWGSRVFASANDQILNGGGELLQYTLPIHDYRGGYGEPELALFYTGRTATGGTTNPAWYWDKSNPGRVTVPSYNGYVMDMRVGSAWVEHLLNDYYPNIAQQKVGWRYSGVFLDVTGDGYFGQMNGGLTASERAEYSAGVRDFVKRLRALLGDEAIIIANNAWSGPIDFIDGILVENHSLSEIPYWRDGQLKYITRTKRRRNLTISRTASDAQGWAQVSGVDAAGAQNNNYQIALPVSGIAIFSLPNHVGSITPAPPPDPDPTPTPTPLPKPVPPSNFKAVAAGDGTSVLLSWDKSPETEKVTFYQVYEGPKGATQPIEIDLRVPSNLYTVHNLTPNTDYVFTVSAQNATDYSDWVEPFAYVNTGPKPVPDPEPDPTPMPDYKALYEAEQAKNAILTGQLEDAGNENGMLQQQIGSLEGALNDIGEILLMIRRNSNSTVSTLAEAKKRLKKDVSLADEAIALVPNFV